MLNKFSDKAQKIIALSESIAFDLGQNNVSTEHLLMAFLKMKDCKLKQLLENFNITYESIKEEVIRLFGKKTNKPFYMEYSVEFKRILENSILLSKKKGEDKVSIDMLSVSLLEDNNCIASDLLNKQSINVNKIKEEIKNQIKRSSELDSLFDLSNLNQKALKKPPILIHRDAEINSLIEILLRKQKPNAVIVGPPGVGKTALVEYLAHLININKVPENLKDKVIYEMDISSIIAGTKYRGEFEDKLKKILKKVKEDKHAIIFIDEIHNIVGAGGAEGAIDASNIIKPYLSRGDICCIGATTYDEYVKLFEKEKALERRFQVVKLAEPTLEQTIDILKAVKQSFMSYHNLSISNDSIRSLAYLCKQYVFDRCFPDKAIDILDMACVRCKNTNEKILKKEHIIDVIENNYNVKIEINNKAASLENNLKEMLYGQDKAIKEICNQIRFIELGMSDSNKPLGVFLFVGPTGVGKTESAKQIARHYFGSETKCVKLDMSEYSDAASVTKLIGSPPGYVGYEKQSLLVDHIRNNPYSVVILDEVEKAHRDILDVFLNVFDEGYFVDANKKKIEFTNSIIIMTSNLGFSEEMFHKGKVGYVNNKVNSVDINKVIERHFRPEFINRIDEIVFFDSLSSDVCKQLVGKYIDEYKHKIDIELDDSLIVNNIIKDDKISRYGARGIKRKVKKEILNQLDKQKVYKV